MELGINKTYTKPEQQSQDQKDNAVSQEIKQFERTVKKLRLQLDSQNIEIRLLKKELKREEDFSCEHVFHSYAVYRGTDTIALCNCRKDYTSFLPNEIIVEIFHNLPQEFLNVCAKVCRRWDTLSRERSLWKSRELNGGVVTMNDIDEFITLGTKTLVLSVMEIHGYPLNENDVIVDEAGGSSFQPEEEQHDNWNELDTLELISVNIENHLLCEFLLKYATITSLTFEDLHINSEVFNAISKLENLISLTLNDVDVGSKCLQEIFDFQNWIYLKHLHVLKGVFFKKGSNEKFEKIIQKCPNLISLNIDYCKGLTQTAIYHISSHLPKLQFLSLLENDRLNHNLSALKNISTLKEICITCETDDVDPMLQCDLRNVKFSVTPLYGFESNEDEDFHIV